MNAQAKDIKPAFVVQRIQGKYERTVVRYSKDENKKPVRNEEVEEFEDGYMVYFPRGHSIFVKTDKELERLGFANQPDLIDMNSGDIVGQLGIPLAQVVTKQNVTRPAAKK